MKRVIIIISFLTLITLAFYIWKTLPGIINIYSENHVQQSPEKILELPVIGTFNLSSMNTDSTNVYGGGDCQGVVTRYSIPEAGLAVDSLNCGEWGYTFSYYLLSDKDFIQVLYRKSSELIIADNKSYYLLKEEITDFNADPAEMMIRIDTGFNLTDTIFNKKFETKKVINPHLVYDSLEKQYQNLWIMRLE